MQLQAIGARDMPHLTYGKVYDVLEEIPSEIHANIGWIAPAAVIIQDDSGREGYYHRRRFEEVTP